MQEETATRFRRELSRAFKVSLVVAVAIVGVSGAAILATNAHALMLAIVQLMALFSVVIASALFIVCGLPEAAIRAAFDGIAVRIAARTAATLAVGLIVHRVMFSMFDGRETYRTFGNYLSHAAAGSPLWAFAPFALPLLFFASYAALARRESQVRPAD